MGTTLETVRKFPEAAKREAGYQLFRVQAGHLPADYRPMPSVGAGVIEIRVRSGGEYRILYVSKYRESVYVIHAFVKKTQRTTHRDIELAASRYKAFLAAREEHK